MDIDLYIWRENERKEREGIEEGGGEQRHRVLALCSWRSIVWPLGTQISNTQTHTHAHTHMHRAPMFI